MSSTLYNHTHTHTFFQRFIPSYTHTHMHTHWAKSYDLHTHKHIWTMLYYSCTITGCSRMKPVTSCISTKDFSHAQQSVVSNKRQIRTQDLTCTNNHNSAWGKSGRTGLQKWVPMLVYISTVSNSVRTGPQHTSNNTFQATREQSVSQSVKCWKKRTTNTYSQTTTHTGLEWS